MVTYLTIDEVKNIIQNGETSSIEFKSELPEGWKKDPKKMFKSFVSLLNMAYIEGEASLFFGIDENKDYDQQLGLSEKSDIYNKFEDLANIKNFFRSKKIDDSNKEAIENIISQELIESNKHKLPNGNYLICLKFSSPDKPLPLDGKYWIRQMTAIEEVSFDKLEVLYSNKRYLREININSLDQLIKINVIECWKKYGKNIPETIKYLGEKIEILKDCDENDKNSTYKKQVDELTKLLEELDNDHYLGQYPSIPNAIKHFTFILKVIDKISYIVSSVKKTNNVDIIEYNNNIKKALYELDDIRKSDKLAFEKLSEILFVYGPKFANCNNYCILGSQLCYTNESMIYDFNNKIKAFKEEYPKISELIFCKKGSKFFVCEEIFDSLCRESLFPRKNFLYSKPKKYQPEINIRYECCPSHGVFYNDKDEESFTGILTSDIYDIYKILMRFIKF